MDLTSWLNDFSEKLTETFGNRLWFLGVQGSYGRDEATETSDIDVVTVLEELTLSDIEQYNSVLDSLPHRKLVCGFLSGKKELFSWETSDLFQFYYDTKPIKGSLEELLPLIDESSLKRAIKIGLCNIFHGCVHNMLHEKSDEILKNLYKSASFTLQAMAFRKTGTYFKCQSQLVAILPEEDKIIGETFLKLKKGGVADFSQMSETLFLWAQKRILNGGTL